MARSTTHYGDWQQHDGKEVVVDGLRCRLRCEVFRQRYPYPDEVISVHAVPLSTRSKLYRAIRHQLGDDWSTDVLDSDIDLQVDVLEQLERSKR